MKWFLNLKIASKLALGFGTCMALCLMTGVIALARMGQMNSNTNDIVTDALAQTANVGRLTNYMRKFRMYEFNYLLRTNDQERKQIGAEMQDVLNKVEVDLSRYEKQAVSEQEKSGIANLRSTWKTYMARHQQQLDLSQSGESQKSATLIFDRKADFDQVSDQLQKMSDGNEKAAAQLSSQAASSFASARVTMISLLLLATIVAFAIAYATAKVIRQGVEQISNRLRSLSTVCIANLATAVKALENGDLTAKIKTGTEPVEMDTKDELGLMAADVNAIIANAHETIRAFENSQEALSVMLAQVRAASDAIASGSVQVSAGNTDLSSRTEEQAASLEETASSMEEMTSTITQNAQNSKLANQLASQAMSVAGTGGEVVKNAVTAMGEINEGSRRIADIISVIDEIAFQTNLLALNAAVEAARVGEQGRGFAVVAAEVRNLAGRSATAAKEIKALVQDSVTKVQVGSELVNESGDRLREIVDSSKKVADVIGEISAASMEQAAGVEQVNKAVMQMDQMTQQNAALVEEVSASSQSMTVQAKELQAIVSKFKIDTKFLLSVQQNVVVHKPALAATGTHGKPASRPQKSANKLKVVEQGEEFEEF